MKLSEFRAKVALLATLVVAAILVAGGIYFWPSQPTEVSPLFYWAGALAAVGQALICGLALWGLILSRQQKELAELPTAQAIKPTIGDMGTFRMSLGDDTPVSASSIAPKKTDEVKTLETGFQRMVVGLSAALLLGMAALIAYLIYRNVSSVTLGQQVKVPLMNPLGVVIGIGALAIHLVAFITTRVTRKTVGTGEAVSSSLIVGIPGMIAVAAASILIFSITDFYYVSEVAAGVIAFFMAVQGFELAANSVRSYAGIEEFDQEPVDLQALPLVPMLNSVWVNGLRVLLVQSFGLVGKDNDRIGGAGVFARMMPRALLALLIIAIGVSCLRSVEPGQVAIRERLGHASDDDINNPLTPGLHVVAPWPIDTLVHIPVAMISRISVGADEETEDAQFSFWSFKHTTNDEPDFITGDQQFVGGYVEIWWRVKSATDFYRNLSHSEHLDSSGSKARVRPIYEAIIQETATQTMTKIFGVHTMEQIISTDRAEVQSHARNAMQANLDSLKSGIEIVSLSIKDVHPPKGDDDVVTAGGVRRGPASAYEWVVSAQERKKVVISLAEADKTRYINRANGDSAAIRAMADAYKINAIAGASGQRDRRAALIEQFSKNPEVGRDWMTYQMLGESLPGINKIILGRNVESPSIWQPGKDSGLPKPMPTNP